jgi:hypothetical protein
VIVEARSEPQYCCVSTRLRRPPERHCRRKGDSNGPGDIKQAIKLILAEVHLRLREAARIAKAAEACAVAGSIGEGVILSMDIEQLIYEAGRLHDAAALLNRLSSS